MFKFDPAKNLLGEYGPLDGTMEFYGRINAIIKNTDFVLDLGAGRGSWFFDDNCSYRRNIRNIKDKVKYLVGVDIDKAIFENQTTHKNIIMKSDKIPLDDNSMNIVIADWVLEHVQNPDDFVKEIYRVLKPGGFFCARTPHKYKYISILASLIKNKHHSKVLRFIQPERKEIDTFPTAYKINTLKIIRKYFFNFKNFSYLYTSQPSYYANSKFLFQFFSFLHKVLPAFMVSEIFVFLQKN
jgi:ubiquinone/menaquinone biosynthesis C-methylase UbiE